MRLLEVTKERLATLNEGGSMSGVGAIHISEIEPTLAYLEKSLGGIDLKNNVLGSVGKKEFSGDIDVAIDIEPEALPELLDKLQINPDILDIAKSSVIMTKVKIQGYDANKTTDRVRTGYVQLDFMPGNPGWMKTYYHSPTDQESQYKGVFRNILLAVVCALYDRKDSVEKTEDGRSMESEQYLFSPTNGLVRVKRTPVPKKNGLGFTKQNKNVIINGPWLTPEEIVKVLNLGEREAINSYESLKSAVEQNYPAELSSKILDSFAKNKQIVDIGVPSDLQVDEGILAIMSKLK